MPLYISPSVLYLSLTANPDIKNYQTDTRTTSLFEVANKGSVDNG